MDGCSRAYDNEAAPFSEFDHVLWDTDLNELGALNRDNDRRLDRLKNLISIANKLKTTGNVTLVARRASDWHTARYDRHWFEYSGENPEQC